MTGLELARDYYDKIVRPLVLARWPGLSHAAARLGSGSDVLGLDDEMSRDHDWGLRLTLLVDVDLVREVDVYLEEALPATFRGLPTRFGTTWHPAVHHQAEVSTPEAFAESRLGLDVAAPLDAVDWLSFTGQSVLEVTAGAVFADTDGGITAIRRLLDWYPDDLWRYVLAADWSRIGKELPFLGRAGEQGDELGSRVIAAHLVRSILHLGFLLERQWPPYSKWVGTLFGRLPSASQAAPALARVLAASEWREREDALADALEIMNGLQARIGLPSVASITEQYFGRPFRGVGPVPELLLDSISDPEVRRLPAGVGSLEQWVDNVDVLLIPDRRAAAAGSLREMECPARRSTPRDLSSPAACRSHPPRE
jgi:hypothetical protein